METSLQGFHYLVITHFSLGKCVAVSFMMISLLLLQLESGDFGKRAIAAVSG